MGFPSYEIDAAGSYAKAATGGNSGQGTGMGPRLHGNDWRRAAHPHHYSRACYQTSPLA